MSFETITPSQHKSETQGISAQALTTFTNETPSSNPSGKALVVNEVNPNTISNIIHCQFNELRATPMGNYRKRRNPKKYAETKASVLDRGFLQNIVVREAIDSKGNTELEVIAGYGRWQIAEEIFKEHGIRIPIPCLNKGAISDSEALAIALDENNKRENDSISERAELAKEYIGLEGGDVATAAMKLKVSESQFRELLQLTNCCEELLDALDDDEIKVFKGHCLVLSHFDKAIQKQTLEKIVADPTTYTVSYVKNRLKNLELSLSKAKFDTTECQSCQHNTGGAMCFMFQNEDDDKCSNPSCFQTKSKLWLEEIRKKELEDKFGVVITTTMKPQSQVRAVDPELLGEAQCKDCQGCKHNVVYLNDEPSENFGRASTNICIDVDCHTKLFNAHQEKMKPKQKKSKSSTDNTESAEDTAAFLAKAASRKSQGSEIKSTNNHSSDQNSCALTAQDKVDNKPIDETESKSVAKLSKRMQRTYANMIQEAVSSEISSCEAFAYAFIAKAVDSKLREPLLDKESVDSLTKRPVAELHALINKSIGKFFTQTVLMDSDAADIRDFNANKVLRKSFGHVMALKAEDKENLNSIRQAQTEVIVKSWNPTVDLLNIFTTPQLAIVCNESGFESAYCTSKGSDVALAQIFNSKPKADIIKEVLDFDFDWSSYAPKAYIELGMEYQAPA